MMEHVMDLASEISESSSLVSEDLRTLDGSVDGEPRADGLYEERFRVDRRKLESMLLGEVATQYTLVEKTNVFDVFGFLANISRRDK
jgi:hypothetical protein